MRNLFLFLFALLVITSINAQSTKVLILATGGTIAGAGQAADRAGYQAGALPINDLLNAVPEIHKVAKITGEQISSVGSQDMGITIWLKLAQRINDAFAKNEADAVVITHGTDTKEETAAFLNWCIKYDKPVVITGSMRPATAISADGPKNLLDAVIVAANPASVGKGPMVVFSENIFDARDVTKTSTTHVEAFNAPNTGPIGQVYDGKVIYYQTNTRKSDKNTPFDVKGLTNLPKVEVVYMYADADPVVIDALVAKKVDGLVIAGVGNGNFSKAFYLAIERAVKAGVVVVRASKCYAGRVVLEDEVDDEKLGTIVSDDLNPAKARVLLMLGLTKTKDKKQLQQYFFEY